MLNADLVLAFESLSTAVVADACLRLGVEPGIAPSGIRSIATGSRLAGRARPVRHHGSVDVFLEAIEAAEVGDVLVIDNEGRLDEGCVGDLVALEALAAGLGGIVIWGAHRDTAELLSIDLPVFSCGSWPMGPCRHSLRSGDTFGPIRFGTATVDDGVAVLGDADGVLFLPLDRLDDLLTVARAIHVVERRQADGVQAGRPLREQLQFAAYLSRRAVDPTYTFRDHLRRIGGAIEE
jgi:regulator of RNase E activity RraA